MPDEDWKKLFSEEFQNDPAITEAKSPDSLVKQIRDFKIYQGNSVRIPSEDATDEDLDAFAEKMMERSKGRLTKVPDLMNREKSESFLRSIGMPEEAGGYKLPELEGIDVSVFPEEHVKIWKETAHRVGLTDTQFQLYMAEQMEAAKVQAEEVTAAHDADMKLLYQDWGADADRRIKVAVAYANKSAMPQWMLDNINKGQADSNTLKWIYQEAIAKHGESAEFADQVGGAHRESPADMKAKQEEIMDRVAQLDKENSPASNEKQKKLLEQHAAIGQELGGQDKQ